jgi:hypothetical protein
MLQDGQVSSIFMTFARRVVMAYDEPYKIVFFDGIYVPKVTDMWGKEVNRPYTFTK